MLERSEDPKEIVANLVAKKFRFIAILSAIYLTSYVGLTVLAGFAKPFMMAKALGPLNVGFVLIAANYGLSWALALVYLHVASETFDPLVARVAATLRIKRAL